MMRDRTSYHLAGMLMIVAAGAAAAACDGNATTGTAGAGGSTAGTGGNTAGTGGGTGGSGGGAPAGPFQPQGCKFKGAPRPEYTDWSTGKTDVGATPNIRRVRLGLGGNVAIGAEGRADPSTSIGFAWQTDDGTLATEVQWGSSMD